MSFNQVKWVAGEEKLPIWFFAGIIVLSLIKLWLIKGQTVIAYGTAVYDDRLYLSLAENFLNGKWLGTYHCLTLAKGCFYPIWIALVFLLHIPLLYAQHLLYILAVLVLIFAIRPLLKNPAILLLLFAALLFNPATYTQSSLRVVREGIYPSLSLLVVAGCIGVLGRFNSKKTIFTSWLLALGVLLSAFWLTREEGIWIMPLVALILGWTIFKLWRSSISGWLNRCALCLIPFVILCIVILTVSTLNLICYGAFITVEFKNHDFLEAYGALNRVKPEKSIPRVPVTKETRMRIYPHSPVFAELKPYIEGGNSNVFAEASRQHYPELKGEEIAGGWFMWAFRDAVSAAGYYTSAKKAMAYYNRLAEEINSVCDRGGLKCYPKRSSMMPVWRDEFYRPLFKTITNAAIFLVTFKNMNAIPSNSEGPESLLTLFRDLTRENLSPTGTETIKLNGWTFGTDDHLHYSVMKSDGSPANATIQWNESPDVYSYFLTKEKNFPDAQKARFEISANEEDLYLEARDNDGRFVKKIQLDGKKTWIEDPNFYFRLDSRQNSKFSILPAQARRNQFRVMLLNKIGRFYQIVMPYLTVLSIIMFLAGTLCKVLKKRIISDIGIINFALLTILLSRLYILSVIHITAFPGINTLYLSPAYPLLIMFVLLAISGNGLTKLFQFKGANNKLLAVYRNIILHRIKKIPIAVNTNEK